MVRISCLLCCMEVYLYLTKYVFDNKVVVGWRVVQN